MGGVPTNLLPSNTELARRAAGGDGAAFVRLYDHYSDLLFEASLAATGSAEIAASVTQGAFLKLLRRPPALGAPDSDVAERLYALALGRPAAGAALRNGNGHGNGTPREPSVGWLRSETVAKAGARFDDDWSVHLPC